MRKTLNTSKSTFKDVIESGLMYVDKTEEIYNLVHSVDGQFFLSRPRRFGKSMTLSTLKSIFEGDNELVPVGVNFDSKTGQIDDWITG